MFAGADFAAVTVTAKLGAKTEYRAITVDAGEFDADGRANTEGAILPDNLSGTRTASNWPL
jgi:hypothetical protein